MALYTDTIARMEYSGIIRLRNTLRAKKAAYDKAMQDGILDPIKDAIDLHYRAATDAMVNGVPKKGGEFLQLQEQMTAATIVAEKIKAPYDAELEDVQSQIEHFQNEKPLLIQGIDVNTGEDRQAPLFNETIIAAMSQEA